MKLDVIIPSRGHSVRLMAVLTCFDALASGTHDITYRVVCDLDDPLTYKSASVAVPLQVAIHAGSGPLAKRMNEAAMEGNADAVTCPGDDSFPLCQHWDAVIAMGLDHGLPAFSWYEVNDPNSTSVLVCSRKWLNAVGRMVPEYFPFWFGDTWVAETFEMAFHKPLPIIQNLAWGGKRGMTKGMRDLKFWFDFFAATRVERMSEARAMCFASDMAFTPNPEMLKDMKRRDLEQAAKIPEFEKAFGADQGEPSETYLQMKSTAEQWLLDHILEVA